MDELHDVVDTPVIPCGYSVVTTGTLQHGDLGWNPTKTCWQEVAETAVILGHPVEQYYIVVRQVKSSQVA